MILYSVEKIGDRWWSIKEGFAWGRNYRQKMRAFATEAEARADVEAIGAMVARQIADAREKLDRQNRGVKEYVRRALAQKGDRQMTKAEILAHCERLQKKIDTMRRAKFCDRAVLANCQRTLEVQQEKLRQVRQGEGK